MLSEKQLFEVMESLAEVNPLFAKKLAYWKEYEHIKDVIRILKYEGFKNENEVFFYFKERC